MAELPSGSRETEGGFFDFEELLQNTQDSPRGALLTVWESILVHFLSAGESSCGHVSMCVHVRSEGKAKHLP